VSHRWAVFAYHTFGARALEALLARDERVVAVVTHVDDPSEGDWFESVADVAREHRLPLFTPPSPNLPVIVETLRALGPDMLLSVWYRRLLGTELLALPRIAALNLHGSLLPKYRGRAPVNWALVNGESRTGVTLHHMIAEADAGDIVAQEAFDIDPEDTSATLYRRIVKVGVDLLLDAYPAVLAGTVLRRAQDHAQATVFPRRRPEDGRVEWRWPARRIADMIRAVTHPYPGAFIGDGTARLYLWAGSVVSDGASPAAPGTLVDIRPGEGVAVATGKGVLLLRRVQSASVLEEPADIWALRRGVHPGVLITGAI
jgi:UDP-4-amino-4-deoxy-L-arabinose formyltransferase/UDP-glucuronic acid dehydrogenase (UDP-4-keto-hexauronic acid decarboxylating)